MTDKLSEVMGRLAMAGSFAVTPVIKGPSLVESATNPVSPPPIVERAPQVISTADKTCFTPSGQEALFATKYEGSVEGVCWAVGMFPQGTVSIWKTGEDQVATYLSQKTGKLTVLNRENILSMKLKM